MKNFKFFWWKFSVYACDQNVLLVTFYVISYLKAFLCTGGDSTFSLSMLKVSRISSFLKCSMVSAISLALPPRFLVNVSFKCSLRLLGVVVLKWEKNIYKSLEIGRFLIWNNKTSSENMVFFGGISGFWSPWTTSLIDYWTWWGFALIINLDDSD